MKKEFGKGFVKVKFVSKALKDDVDLFKAVETSKTLQHDITFIQETHRTGSDILNFDDGWKFLHSLRQEHAEGVGMIISPNVVVDYIDYVMDSHIVHTLLSLNGIKISAICAYNDKECSTESSNLMLFSKLKKTIAINKNKYPEHRTLVVGNFNNFIETENFSSKYIDEFDDKFESNYKKLCTMCEDLNLYVLNAIPHDERMNSFTWKHPTGYIRHVDYFLADYLMTQCTTSCIAYRDDNKGHEKSEILLILGLQCTKFTHYLEQLLTDIEDEVDPDMIEDASVDMTTTNELTTQPPTPKRPLPWYDDKYQALLQTIKKCKDVGEKKELKGRMKKQRIRLKTAYYKQKVASVDYKNEMSLIQDEFRKFEDFNASKKIKASEVTNTCIRHILQSHTGNEKQPELINPENFPFLKSKFIEQLDQSPPSEKEIKMAIKNIYRDKHRETGQNIDENKEYINSAPFSQLIISLMRSIWAVIIYPACWLHSRLSCFLKNTSHPNAVKNYQGISVGVALNKIITSILFGRIKNLYESNIMECQFGFHKNRSSVDAVFTIRKVIDFTEGFFVACFVDIESSYNHISCDNLFDVLEIRTGSKLVSQLIREMYFNTTAAMHSAKESIRTFVGCSRAESPCLFKIYIDFVLRICQHEVLQKYPNTGLKYNIGFPPECCGVDEYSECKESITLRLLACADDLVILSRDVSEMEDIMRVYHRIFKRFGLTIDVGKIKTIVFNASNEMSSKESLISIDNKTVENVREIRFLGYVVSNINQHEDVDQQISFAFRKWSEMENVLTDREIQLPIRIQLLETFVRSRLLYLVQAHKLNALNMKKVDGVWTHLLRRMVKGGFKRHKNNTSDVLKESYLYSNSEISIITKSLPISTFCEKQYLKYIARVIRQHNSFYPKIMLFVKPERRNVRDEWNFLEEFTGLDKTNLRTIMMDKNRFTKWLHEREKK